MLASSLSVVPSASKLVYEKMCCTKSWPRNQVNTCWFVLLIGMSGIGKILTSLIGEVVFMLGNCVGSRGDFLSLCPGRVVNGKVVELMAKWQTTNRATNDTTGVWCLPPAFASDVAHGHSAVELFDKYSEVWFRPYEKLTLIYVPICDDSGHWFLSVISFETQLIFHMDTFITYDTINQRRDIIRAVAETLAEITKFIYTDDQVEQGFFSFNNWNIVEARNAPRCGNSDTAAVCIMEWMGMGTTFLPNVSLVVNDKVLRMRLALLAFGEKQSVAGRSHHSCKQLLEDTL